MGPERSSLFARRVVDDAVKKNVTPEPDSSRPEVHPFRQRAAPRLEAVEPSPEHHLRSQDLRLRAGQVSIRVTRLGEILPFGLLLKSRVNFWVKTWFVVCI